MADTTPDATDTPKPGSKLPLILGVILAVLGGAGSFFAVRADLVPFLGGAPEALEMASPEASAPAPLPNIVFVPVDPVVVSIGAPTANRHLKMRAQLEVHADHAQEVESLLPRVMDVLNSYLRALELADFESRAALMSIRAQLLRRVQVVTGEGRVRDLLIMEFVLN